VPMAAPNLLYQSQYRHPHYILQVIGGSRTTVERSVMKDVTGAYCDDHRSHSLSLLAWKLRCFVLLPRQLR
jgi:hypothetical protein